MVRDQLADVAGFQRAYAEAVGTDAELPAFGFGDTPALADELAALVRSGRKRATAALLADLEHDRDPVPRPGDRSIVLDGRRDPLCVVETVDVRVGPLESVDPAFAWDEGEGDRTREAWLTDHRRFFARRCADLGLELTAEIATVFERFAVVWPARDAPQPLIESDGVGVRETRWHERRRAAALRVERSGGPAVATPGAAYDISRLPGLVAERAGRWVGLATFRPWPGGDTDVVTLDALEPGQEPLLLSAFEALARREGWRRLRTP